MCLSVCLPDCLAGWLSVCVSVAYMPRHSHNNTPHQIHTHLRCEAQPPGQAGVDGQLWLLQGPESQTLLDSQFPHLLFWLILILIYLTTSVPSTNAVADFWAFRLGLWRWKLGAWAPPKTCCTREHPRAAEPRKVTAES